MEFHAPSKKIQPELFGIKSSKKSLVAFVVVCLLLSATYLSFQSLVNEWLQPVVERIFRKKHPQIEQEVEIEQQPEKDIFGCFSGFLEKSFVKLKCINYLCAKF